MREDPPAPHHSQARGGPLQGGRPPDLTDGVVRLRPWTYGDLDCVRQAAADPRVRVGTTVPAAFTREAGEAFVRRQRRRAADGKGWSSAITDAATDRALGLLWLGARPQPGVVGLGYWVVPGARRRGWARRAVRTATDWALGQGGMARVEAWVEPDNTPSQQLLTACGFVREGVLRSFLQFGERRADVVVYSRIAADPSPPRGDR